MDLFESLFGPDPYYILKEQFSGGKRYAVSRYKRYDREKDKTKTVTVRWGTLDENKKFFPSKNYLDAMDIDKKHLIFPEDWDLSELERISPYRGNRSPDAFTTENCLQYGDVWLLDMIAESIDLKDDLTITFNWNEDMAKAALTVAYFLLCTNGEYNTVGDWTQNTRVYSNIKPITEDLLTKLVLSVTGRHIGMLMARRCKRAERERKTNYLAAETVPPIVHKLDRSVTDVVVYSGKDHIPIYYRDYYETRTSEQLLELVRNLWQDEFCNLTLVTDRTVDSLSLIDPLLKEGSIRVIAKRDVKDDDVVTRINEFGDFFYDPEGMKVVFTNDGICSVKQYDVDYRVGKKKIRNSSLVLAFDSIEHSAAKNRKFASYCRQKSDLEEIKENETPLDADKFLERNYHSFKLDYDPQTRILRDFSPLVDEKHLTDPTSGFSAYSAFGLKMAPEEILNLYQVTTLRHKILAKKDYLIIDFEQVEPFHEVDVSKGFFLFIAHILAARLNYLRVTKLRGLRVPCGSIDKVLAAMRSIRFIHDPKTGEEYMTRFNEEQTKITEACGFRVPKGCRPRIMKKKPNPEIPSEEDEDEDEEDEDSGFFSFADEDGIEEGEEAPREENENGETNGDEDGDKE